MNGMRALDKLVKRKAGACGGLERLELSWCNLSEASAIVLYVGGMTECRWW